LAGGPGPVNDPPVTQSWVWVWFVNRIQKNTIMERITLFFRQGASDKTYWCW